MATTSWTGASSTDPTDNANWSGNAPGNNDLAIVPLTASNNMAGGTLTSTIANWFVTEGSEVAIGTSGSPLIVSITTLDFRGAAEAWFQDGSGVSTDAVINAWTPDTVVHLDGDTYTNIYAIQGNISLDAAIGTIARLVVGRFGKPSTVRVTGASGITAVTELIQFSGIALLSHAITTARMMAGQLELLTTAAIGTINQFGGTIWYDTSGTLTKLNGYGGVFNAQRTGAEKTITNADFWPGFLSAPTQSTTLVTYTTLPRDFRRIEV